MGDTAADLASRKHTGDSRRKQEQLDIALSRDVAAGGITAGFEDYYFEHRALPELDLAAVDISSVLFGKTLRAPLLVSPMVGGIEAAHVINRNLAQAAQRLGVAMGVGSQRTGLENEGSAWTYRVRDVAPDILLFANLGAVQLNYGYGVAECRRAVEMLEADALILHLNPLQEALQTGGNANFAGLLEKIAGVCHALTVPVVVKEAGWGISETVARELAGAGVAAIDVAGAGGTSWSEVEKHRARAGRDARVAASFAGWGIPAAEAVVAAGRGAPGLPLIASGGVRSGLDVAKAIALGADAAGIALPLLRAARQSAEAVIEALAEIIAGLQLTMFCTGTPDLAALKSSPALRKR